jgi:hypothetical protein
MKPGLEPGTPRWEELVQQGILKDGERNWFLGDAALEIAPMGADSAHNGRDALLAQYADEVGIGAGSLIKYRQVADAWPPETRVLGASWTVHRVLKGQHELIEPGMTVTAAHRVRRQLADPAVQAVAAGAARPAPSAPEADAIDGARRRERLFAELKRVVAAVVREGPYDEESEWAGRLRTAQLAILDAIPRGGAA